jgi:hypothetical protein
MSIGRFFCFAMAGAAYLGLASPAMAYDSRHHVIYPLSTIKPAGVPIATRTTAQVLYVVPVVPTVFGIRPAPVGQPVIYVIEQPDVDSSQNHRGRGGDSGPRVQTIEP